MGIARAFQISKPFPALTVRENVRVGAMFGRPEKIDHEKVVDEALAITGIAGPEGGTEQKPVGLVYISVRAGNICQVHRFLFANAGRAAIRRRAAQTALNLLRLQLTI